MVSAGLELYFPHKFYDELIESFQELWIGLLEQTKEAHIIVPSLVQPLRS